MAYELYPAVDENFAFPPVVRQSLAKSMDLRNTVIPMTTIDRNNLSLADLWDGRVIANITTDTLERYDSGTTQWQPLLELVSGDLRYMQRTGGTVTGPVNSFADASDRDTALPSPVVGLTCFLQNWQQTQIYSGTQWIILLPTPWVRTYYSSNQGTTNGGALQLGTATLSTPNAPFTSDAHSIVFQQPGTYSVFAQTRTQDTPSWFYIRTAGSTAVNSPTPHRAALVTGGDGSISFSTWIVVTAPGQSLVLIAEQPTTSTIEPLEMAVVRISY